MALHDRQPASATSGPTRTALIIAILFGAYLIGFFIFRSMIIERSQATMSASFAIDSLPTWFVPSDDLLVVDGESAGERICWYLFSPATWLDQILTDARWMLSTSAGWHDGPSAGRTP